jgi:ssDNA-binding Zn-finger/Zn-ribbon topoisomerase 1
MIEMLATLLIVIAAPKGEMRMQFYIPTMEQCKEVESALVQHFSRFGRIVEHGCSPYKDERTARTNVRLDMSRSDEGALIGRRPPFN